MPESVSDTVVARSGALQAIIKKAIAEAIAEAVPIAVEETIRKHHVNCRIPLEPDAVKEVPHIVGMLSDVGGGSIRAGVETIRENHKFITSLQGKATKVVMAIIIAGLTTVSGGALAALWYGIKHALREIKP